MKLELLALEVQCSYWASLAYELVYYLNDKLGFKNHSKVRYDSTGHTACKLRCECATLWSNTMFRNRVLMNAYHMGRWMAEDIWNGSI